MFNIKNTPKIRYFIVYAIFKQKYYAYITKKIKDYKNSMTSL